MPGIEQKPHLSCADIHQGVNILLALNERAHVMMIGKTNPFARHDRRHFRNPPAKLTPLAAREARPCGERTLKVAVYACAHVREHQTRASEGLEQIEVGTQALKLGADAPLQQLR